MARWLCSCIGYGLVLLWTHGLAAQTIVIGETGLVSWDDSGNANLLVAQSAVLAQTALLERLAFYVVTAAGALRLGLYDASGPNGGPGQKKAETAALMPTPGWVIAPVTTPVSLTPGTYWLAYAPSSNTLAFKYGEDSTSSGRYYAYTYGPLPETFSPTPNSVPGHWSFYAILTLSGSPPLPASQASVQFFTEVVPPVRLEWFDTEERAGQFALERDQQLVQILPGVVGTGWRQAQDDAPSTGVHCYRVRQLDDPGGTAPPSLYSNEVCVYVQ